MKNPILKTALAAFLIFASLPQLRAQQPTTPLEMNDYLTNFTDSLYAMGQRWGLAFNEAHKNKDYASLAASRKELQQFIDKSISTVRTLPDINNSKPLRMAMIEFLQFEKRMAVEAFMPFENLKPDASDGEVKAVLQNLTDLSAGEKDVLQKVGAAQETYAKENGFTIEPEKAE